MFRTFKFWRWPPPLLYGLLYLGAIFGFAEAYHSMPGQFVHTTIEHEAPLRNDAAFIKSKLASAMISSYKDSHGGSSILKGNGWIASVDDMTLTDMTYKERTFGFSVTLPKRQADATKPMPPGKEPDFIVAFAFPRPEKGVDAQVDRSRPTGERLYMTFPQPATDNNVLKLLGAHVGGPDDEGVMTFEHDMFMRMIAYADARDGFPGHSSGSFWRMFYLSAVTITTLGYGDILPITPLARILVSAEAIVGTIIIGLYLWALTRHIETRRDYRRPE
jgi:Ion channel